MGSWYILLAHLEDKALLKNYPSASVGETATVNLFSMTSLLLRFPARGGAIKNQGLPIYITEPIIADFSDIPSLRGCDRGQFIRRPLLAAHIAALYGMKRTRSPIS
jgi:hypothetical protein